jgi:hypothetical protein
MPVDAVAGRPEALTRAPGEDSTTFSAAGTSCHCRPSVDDHSAKRPSTEPAENMPSAPAATMLIEDGASVGGTVSATKGAPAAGDIHTAACSDPPTPVEPTVTVALL